MILIQFSTNIGVGGKSTKTRYHSRNNSIIKVTFVLFSFSTQTLIQQGRCDINALGRNSATPLHLAAEMDNADICKILVSQLELK